MENRMRKIYTNGLNKEIGSKFYVVWCPEEVWKVQQLKYCECNTQDKHAGSNSKAYNKYLLSRIFNVMSLCQTLFSCK